MTATSLADLTIRACSAVSTVISAPTGRPTLLGGWLLRELGAADLGVQRQLAFLDRLEGDVGRHDLGERGRMPLVVVVLGVEDSPSAGIEQQRRPR